VVGEQLQGDDRQNGADVVGDFWDGDDVVSDTLQLLRAIAGGNGDDRAFSGADLLDVVQVFGKDGVVGFRAGWSAQAPFLTARDGGLTLAPWL
jgi:hypothetical protein